jgi:hypothetical protein
MEYDKDRVDDAALALLFLTTFKDHGLVRAWKGLDWDVLSRLFEKGFIQDPKGKARSVIMTEQGQRRSEELFQHLFGAK